MGCNISSDPLPYKIYIIDTRQHFSSAKAAGNTSHTIRKKGKASKNKKSKSKVIVGANKKGKVIVGANKNKKNKKSARVVPHILVHEKPNAALGVNVTDLRVRRCHLNCENRNTRRSTKKSKYSVDDVQFTWTRTSIR